MVGTYTLDKLVAVMRVKTSTVTHLFTTFRQGMHDAWFGSLAKDWIGYGFAGFHDNLTIQLDTGESFYFGSRPNQDPPNEYWETCKVEFNPAKVGASQQFTMFYNQLIQNCKWIDFKRFDVAIDIPVPREDVMILKDIRKRTTIERSASNKTTYLGCRAQHGQVKLYNKQIESKLDHPLTRLEITLDYANSRWAEFKRLFPQVIVTPELGDLLETDLVLCLACLEHDEYLRMLGKKKRKKIETLLQQASPEFKPCEVSYACILSDILAYGKGVSIEQHRFIDLGDDTDPFPASFGEVTGEQEEL